MYRVKAYKHHHIKTTMIKTVKPSLNDNTALPELSMSRFTHMGKTLPLLVPLLSFHTPVCSGCKKKKIYVKLNEL